MNALACNGSMANTDAIAIGFIKKNRMEDAYAKDPLFKDHTMIGSCNVLGLGGAVSSSLGQSARIIYCKNAFSCNRRRRNGAKSGPRLHAHRGAAGQEKTRELTANGDNKPQTQANSMNDIIVDSNYDISVLLVILSSVDGTRPDKLFICQPGR